MQNFTACCPRTAPPAGQNRPNRPQPGPQLTAALRSALPPPAGPKTLFKRHLEHTTIMPLRLLLCQVSGRRQVSSPPLKVLTRARTGSRESQSLQAAANVHIHSIESCLVREDCQLEEQLNQYFWQKTGHSSTREANQVKGRSLRHLGDKERVETFEKGQTI